MCISCMHCSQMSIVLILKNGVKAHNRLIFDRYFNNGLSNTFTAPRMAIPTLGGGVNK